jgi:hypothetical protein
MYDQCDELGSKRRRLEEPSLPAVIQVQCQPRSLSQRIEDLFVCAVEDHVKMLHLHDDVACLTNNVDELRNTSSGSGMQTEGKTVEQASNPTSWKSTVEKLKKDLEEHRRILDEITAKPLESTFV